MLTGRFGERKDDQITEYASMSVEHLSSGHKRVIEPDMFESSLSSNPPKVRQQQQLINMRVDQEDVERPSPATEIVPSVPSAEDLSCQRDGCYCWSNSNTEVLLRDLEFHFYGIPGEENSPAEFRSDDAEAVDFSEMQLDRCVSCTVTTAVVQEHQQHPEAILLDDKFLLEHLPFFYDEYNSINSPPPCGDDSRRDSQERRVNIAVSESLPLPEIKRNGLFSSRSDEDCASLTPSFSSAVPAKTTKQHYGSLKDINETSDWNKQQQQQRMSARSKRGREYRDHNWLPSGLLDTSQSDERRNEAKWARRNDGEDCGSQARSTQLITDDSAQCMKEPSGQVDVNQGIPSYLVTIRTIDESAGAVGQSYSLREQILKALNTFEQVRQQIVRDPTYGKALLESSKTTNDRSKGKSKRIRADLKAASFMHKHGLWLNERVRPIGNVPGVVIGDCFRYRIQMAVIGLHRAFQAGIAVVPPEFSRHDKPVACSVVFGVSEYYQDDKDMGEIVEYSGQGGLCNRTKESQDQKLERGNLALSNSYELKLPVRFIRGYKQQDNTTGISYRYDGLYQVVDMNFVKGVNGKNVFKFLMKRLPGQPPLAPKITGAY